MLVPLESSSAVLVMMRSKSVSTTVLVLDKCTVAETARFKGEPKFDVLVRRTRWT